ncbi:MAG: DUF3147 family protein [Planctomycetaceae bacterium]|nr:DUF3147 family protein [Planctomycetaceae bacterium]MBL4886520.1 DUF3147 family protein [Planctomycetaceae bacterium]
MTYYIIKLIISAGLIVAVSEISKRSSFLGGLLASLPLVSFIAMIWMYVETGSNEKVAELSRSVFWLVLPSLPFFLLLPLLLKRGYNFYLSFAVATTIMICLYLLMIAVLRKIGVQL